MDGIVEFYNKNFPDHRLDHYPFVEQPWSMLSILALYLYAVYYYFPSHMVHRKPYNLKKVLIVYNIVQVILNSWGVYAIITSGWTTHYSVIGCFGVEPPEDEMGVRMAKSLWWVWIFRMLDLVETVFFILRKKYNQVSFLHVYHHTLVIASGWIMLKTFPGGMFTFIVILNNSVHVVLYVYYLLSSLGPKVQQQLVKFKSKITTLQMVQLTAMIIHSIQVFLPSCKVTIPSILMIYGYINISLLLSLFIHFYVSNYIKKRV